MEPPPTRSLLFPFTCRRKKSSQDTKRKKQSTVPALSNIELRHARPSPTTTKRRDEHVSGPPLKPVT
ncbi:hypothetical protein G6O67_000506 [Ophiocordyceps sinensis]|uniref:Uncharacterized protein n=1 Tax=Ophiocordyceps sinensis TaxID=72228 RepID=A0A8H4PZ59_9HYPO|nr:hypothetical protein G6O67_000506 [Ophiocordyceps sinensis]